MAAKCDYTIMSSNSADYFSKYEIESVLSRYAYVGFIQSCNDFSQCDIDLFFVNFGCCIRWRKQIALSVAASLALLDAASFKDPSCALAMPAVPRTSVDAKRVDVNKRIYIS